MTKGSVLITGCSVGGIGSALVEAFQAEGYHVFATARDPAKMAHLEHLDRVTPLEMDVTDRESVEATYNTIKAHSASQGRLDYLVNNAGRNFFGPILDLNIDDGRKLFETNLWGPITVIQRFAPLLIAAKGVLVNITSISGYLNIPWMGVYSASKRSLELVSETLRLELAPFGVRVVSVVTGAVKSRGQTYFTDFRLPTDSLYSTIESNIATRAQGGDGIPRMDTKEFATNVLRDLMAGQEGKIWHGNNAEQTKQGQGLPASVMDGPLMIGTGLDVMNAKEG